MHFDCSIVLLLCLSALFEINKLVLSSLSALSALFEDQCAKLDFSYRYLKTSSFGSEMTNKANFLNR
jgi:hypothetical protein